MQHLLIDPELGELDLSCENGYVVESYDLGVPETRTVMSNRTFTNGAIDRTRFYGARTVALNITLDGSVQSCSRLRDRLAAYLRPFRRVEYRFIEPGDDRERRMLLRGAQGGVPIAHPRFNKMAVSFVCPDGVIEGVDEKIITLYPGADTEFGRSYDLTFDRVYPNSPTIGTRLITNDGTEDAHWRARIYGAMTDPVLSLDSDQIDFSGNLGAGLSLSAGQPLTIDSRERAAYLDGNVSTPALQFVDFTNTTWWTIPPGTHQLRIDAASFDSQASVVLVYRDCWA